MATKSFVGYRAPNGYSLVRTVHVRFVLVILAVGSFLTVTLLPLVLPPFRRVLEDVRSDYARAERNAELLTLLDEFPDQREVPFAKFQLNVGKSNRVPLDRNIPDTRARACQNRKYDTGDLDVSIVIPFHDESWSMLLRALHSIVDRTPGHLLREIILIDDASHHEYLGEPLLGYLPVLSRKVRLFRNLRREGLIRSRVRGAKVARGKVLVFLDAHVEVNVMWLEPLLAHIIEKAGKVLAVPHIDMIDAGNIAYKSWEQRVHGGFSWALEYVWKFVPQATLASRAPMVDPVPTPTTIGCAMAIERDYFFLQGAFDEGMLIWGGENLEISFRMWMCGGEVNIVPCSRVGHVFRKLLPYYVPLNVGGNETRYKNYQRLADVWMDEYKYYYYAASHLHLAYTEEERRSLEERRQLKARLKCRDFSWYLTHVVPEMGLPPRENVTYFGQIGNTHGNACMTRTNTSYDSVILDTCGRYFADQSFYLSESGHLKTTDDYCISANKSSRFLQLLPCGKVDDKIMQTFTFDTSQRPTPSPLEGLVKNAEIGRLTMTYRGRLLCVEQVSSLMSKQQVLGINPCTDDYVHNFQLWSFSYQFDYSHVEKVKKMMFTGQRSSNDGTATLI